MKTKILLLVGMVAGLIAVLTIPTRHPVPTPFKQEIAAPAPVSPSIADSPAPLVESEPPPPVVKAESPAEIQPQKPSPPKQAQKQPRQKPALVDPLAREALSWVGADPEADEYWLVALSNPDLPLKEREDLIEDLNEEGFLDPKHPTLEELPLILNRLALLIQAGQDPDDVNAKSFAEAYKDLINLADLAVGEGKPVQ